MARQTIGVLIFSKDRPAQLDLLLRSQLTFWEADNEVLYTYSSPEYEKGYELLKKKFPKTKFTKEKDFRNEVMDSLRQPYHVFFCDDDVMIRPFSEEDSEFRQFTENPFILSLSLRMDPHYNYDFNTDSKVPLPNFYNNMWEWFKYGGDWGFPMATVGHIYRTSELKEKLEKGYFRSPNSMEGLMAREPINHPLMSCYQEARVINIPSNLVQTEVVNKAGNISPRKLNKDFLAGKVIELTSVINKAKLAKSCFTLTGYKLV